MRTGVLVAIAAGLIGLGLILGLAPGSTQGATRTFSCGSPWSPDTKEMDHQEYIDDLANAMAGSKVWSTDYRERCDDAFGGRGVWGGALAGLGALMLVGIAVTRGPKQAPVSPAAPESAEPGA